MVFNRSEVNLVDLAYSIDKLIADNVFFEAHRVQNINLWFVRNKQASVAEPNDGRLNAS